ncbi:hypothetical protein DPMN_144681 [Dreissena polymorpha]|uniref:Uncharacterized protein n=1 Tax=Dreissena polymorpha TaxID=45954 RepID=A0A9D4F6Y5_DREPO|nr:hypothetical protein DPMN_144681 [Dreissena polymorpha]
MQKAAISERERRFRRLGPTGSGVCHLGQGGTDILDAASGPIVRRVSSVPGWA